MNTRAVVTIQSEADRARVAKWAQNVEVGTIVEFRKKTRSNEQNAKLHAMLGEVAEQVVWYGRKLDSDDWKNLFTASLRVADVVPGIDRGTIVPLGIRTSSMTIEEMGNLITLIYAFGDTQTPPVKFKEPREQNTETSADVSPPEADAGSDVDAISPDERVASAPLADDEPALESSGDDVASPSSSLDSEIDDFAEQTTGRNPAVIRELKRECKDKFLQIATSDLPAGERRGVLERTKNVWKDELPEGLEFVRICFETADKVIKKELTPEFALKYLNGLVGV